MDRFESAALDRWITRDFDGDSNERGDRFNIPDECEGCGWVPCVCDDRRSDFSDHALGIDY